MRLRGLFCRCYTHLQGKYAVIDDDVCQGCGRCADIRPKKAIEVKIAETDYIDQAIERISRVVNVKWGRE